jgi:hypothetical protein
MARMGSPPVARNASPPAGTAEGESSFTATKREGVAEACPAGATSATPVALEQLRECVAFAGYDAAGLCAAMAWIGPGVLPATVRQVLEGELVPGAELRTTIDRWAVWETKRRGGDFPRAAILPEGWG